MYFSKTYTPEAANLTGFLSNATGASWPLTTVTSGDGLSHKVTIRNDAATDHSGKTAAIVGKDADGFVQTETLTMPAGAATVTSAKFYSSLVSVTPSATIGADTMDIGWTAVSVTPTIGLEKYSTVSAAATIDISGTIDFTAYESASAFNDTPAQNGSWTSITALAAKTADTTSATTVSMQCFRAGVNTVTAGATMKVVVAQGL